MHAAYYCFSKVGYVNLVKVGYFCWVGNMSTIFVLSHLFFTCPVTRVIWLIIAKCFGPAMYLSNFDRFLLAKSFMLGGLVLFAGQCGNVEITLF